jgi:hypothetical protein
MMRTNGTIKAALFQTAFENSRGDVTRTHGPPDARGRDTLVKCAD